jgi:hypothetical protein
LSAGVQPESILQKRFEAMTFQPGARSRQIAIGCVLQFILVTAFAPHAAAEKLVDPNTVAPEYRDAAEKRRAEQLKLVQCSKKADEAKVVRRDRTAFINECLEK